MNKRFVITLATAIFLIAGTLIAIQFAKGYRLNLKNGKVSETGLLVANSYPSGASVYLDGKLATATNNTLNLPPGDYEVKIVKDGYIAWEKKLKLKRELVTQTDARLFPAVPDLKSLTFAGALNLSPSPDGERMAFVVASASASLKNGLYILDLVNNPISLSHDPRQIAQTTSLLDFSRAKLVWSPSGKQILAWAENSSYLLDVDRMNNTYTLNDSTAQLPIILNDWEQELMLKQNERLKKLPAAFVKYASASAKNIYFSPDEQKIMYTALAPVVLPDNLIPPLPASSTQEQARKLEPGKIYVYDIKEDRNFYLGDAPQNLFAPPSPSVFDLKIQTTQPDISASPSPFIAYETRLSTINSFYSPLNTHSFQWFPDSKHLMMAEKEKITILEYDGQNKAVVYAGPFTDSFVYPWPDGNRLLILTNLNSVSKLPANLYAIDLK